MKRFFYISLLLTTVPAFAEGTIPVSIHYFRTGTETPQQAAQLGQQELRNANPCVARMKRQAEDWIASQADLQDATNVLSANFESTPKPVPGLVLRYMNDSIVFQYELRQPATRSPGGREISPERVVFMLSSPISERRGSWSERMRNGTCSLNAEHFSNLVDTLREGDRLASCRKRKQELLAASEPVSNYIHNYLPVDWVREAQQKIYEREVKNENYLSANLAVYGRNEGTYRECITSLRRLEADSAGSVRVLTQVRDSKRAEIPADAVDRLESTLGPSNAGGLPSGDAR